MVFVLTDKESEILSAYQMQLAHEGITTVVIDDAIQIDSSITPKSIVVYIPPTAKRKDDIYAAATQACTGLINVALQLYHRSISAKSETIKLFSVVSKSWDICNLAHSPLHGLSRVLKTEIPEIFGGLFENDRGCFPLSDRGRRIRTKSYAQRHHSPQTSISPDHYGLQRLSRACNCSDRYGLSDSCWCGKRNLFLAPDGFGSGAVFGGLGSLLSSVRNVSVYALNSPFMHSNPDPDDPLTIEELAAIYVGEIKRRQPEGPYLLGGYSVGGVLAFEVARQLLEDGNDIEKLFLIDTACPTFVRYFPDALVRYLDSIEQVRVGNGSELRPNRRGRLVANDHFCLARQQMRAYQVRRLPGRKIPRAVLIAAK